MNGRIPTIVIGASGMLIVFGVLAFAQGARNPPAPHIAPPPPPIQNFDPSKLAPVMEQITLVRARDFHYNYPYDGKWVSCATLSPSAPGAKVDAVRTTSQEPQANRHWWRCGIEGHCGIAEFSDPNDASRDCMGKSACRVCRSTDDGRPDYVDHIEMTSH